MTVDHYAGAARRWADGATLVYRPIARALVAEAPHALAGRRALDVGAGTGVASEALIDAGAKPIALDLSHDMLACDRGMRPPAAVADIRTLPIATGSVDDSVAAFVLNHLHEPVAGLAELVRVTRSGGSVLACVYAATSTSAARDAIDDVARAEGWQAPAWYAHLKATAVPLLATAAAMREVAGKAGLTNLRVREQPVDTGLTDPVDLVDYRFGQAHFNDWIASMAPVEAEAVRARAIDAVGTLSEAYRPIVVFAAGLAP